MLDPIRKHNIWATTLALKILAQMLAPVPYILYFGAKIVPAIIIAIAIMIVGITVIEKIMWGRWKITSYPNRKNTKSLETFMEIIILEWILITTIILILTHKALP